ncbi:MAG: tetratricopeptide repeat protein [bacterium]|nr:tetratricopeptide repeat protein [bacterium]
MAVVGHGLLGLALAGAVPSVGRARRLDAVWVGLLVLLAYAVDVAEWFAVVFNPALIDRRFLSHDPLQVGILAGGVCVVLGVYCRFRRPWPYVVIVGAVFSHLLLDWFPFRLAVEDWYYGSLPGLEDAGRGRALPAETCVYGGPLVLVLLIRAASDSRCPRGARIASWVLAGAAVLGASSRLAIVWVPLYALSVVHALTVLRRSLRANLLWNLIPLLPVVALGSTAWLSAHRLAEARALAREGRDVEALRLYEGALAVPTRYRRNVVYRGMGNSYERLGDLASAEQAFERACSLSPTVGSSQITLGAFYVRHADTPYFRPSMAAALFEQVRAEPDAASISRAYARTRLEWMRRRGLIR